MKEGHCSGNARRSKPCPPGQTHMGRNFPHFCCRRGFFFEKWHWPVDYSWRYLTWPTRRVLLTLTDPRTAAKKAGYDLGVLSGEGWSLKAVWRLHWFGWFWLLAWRSGRTLVFDRFPCPALDLQLTGDHLCG